MAEATNRKSCRKVDCGVLVTGACAEGHTPLESCPNYGKQLAQDLSSNGATVDAPSETAPTPARRVQLSSGDALTPDEVEQFLRGRAATFVSIIGDTHSGKTTLICALYDRFLKGTFGGLAFAGSRTLVAFERRSHHGRVDSGRATPETVRTSHLDGLRYFHVAVARLGDTGKRTDLMVSDRSGEIYQSARDNSHVVESLVEIPQADRIVLLLDGARVAEPFERAGAIQSVRQTIRVFLDNNALGMGSAVQVVTTKVDLIAASSEVNEITATLGSFRERLSGDFRGRLKSLTFHDIAARDPTNGLEPAYGVGALIEDWVTPPIHVPMPPSPVPELHCEFDRLLIRTPGEDSK